MELARNTPIENWDKTFAQVLQNISTSERHVTINPILGSLPYSLNNNNRSRGDILAYTYSQPKPITGSTRMKGGSATKILLETIFAKSISSIYTTPSGVEDYISSSITEILHTYNLIQRFTGVIIY